MSSFKRRGRLIFNKTYCLFERNIHFIILNITYCKSKCKVAFTMHFALYRNNRSWQPLCDDTDVSAAPCWLHYSLLVRYATTKKSRNSMPAGNNIICFNLLCNVFDLRPRGTSAPLWNVHSEFNRRVAYLWSTHGLPTLGWF